MTPDVVLVNLPFAPLAQPSLAFSIFKPILSRAGFKTKILYANNEFARQIGSARYEYIANYQPQTELLIGELLFSQFLNDTDTSQLLAQTARSSSVGESEIGRSALLYLSEAREKVFAFVYSTASALLEMNPRVVCFSSLFQQHSAALSLAKALRARSDQMILIMGGSNCEGEMGEQTAASFATLDFVVSGPGELVLPELLTQLLSNSIPTALDGVFPTARHRSFPRPNARYAQEGELDELPYPDFDDYFAQLHERFGSEIGEVLLPVETSRGCWWGVRNHCTFCGLNGSTMQLRQKSPERAFAEFHRLSEQYPKGRLIPVDNILPNNYFTTLLPKLAREPVGKLFYEVKANLKYEQLRLLRDAMVVEIQPGIESLSDASLRRMRKGVSALQNVLLLRNVKDLGIRTFWNILFGFPNETKQEYFDQSLVIDAISHLPPPVKASKVRIDRFSPLYFEHEVLGIKDVRPVDAYFKVYPGLSDEAVERIAYYFQSKDLERRSLADLQMQIRAQVEHWKAEYPASYLALLWSGNLCVIIDTRTGSNRRVWRVSEREQALLAVTQSIVHRATVSDRLSRIMPVDEAEGMITEWLSARLLLQINDNMVCLVERDAYGPDVIAALLHRCGLGETANIEDAIRIPIHNGEGTQSLVGGAPCAFAVAESTA